jgi:hypothetical protein
MIIARYTPTLRKPSSCKSCEENHREKATKESETTRKEDEQRKRNRSVTTQDMISAHRSSANHATLPITPPPRITPVEASTLIQNSRHEQHRAQNRHHEKQTKKRTENKHPKGSPSEVTAQNPSGIRPIANKALKAQQTQEGRTPNRTLPRVDIDHRITRSVAEIATLVSAPPRLVKHEGRSTPLSHSQLVVDTHKARLTPSERQPK